MEGPQRLLSALEEREESPHIWSCGHDVHSSPLSRGRAIGRRSCRDSPCPLLLGTGTISLRACILTDTKRLILVGGARAPPLNLESCVGKRDDP